MPMPILDLLTNWLSGSKAKILMVLFLRTTFRTAPVSICIKTVASMSSSLVMSESTSIIGYKGNFLC
jgi:hypothetical protein